MTEALKICPFGESPSKFASKPATSIYDGKKNLKEFKEIQNKNQVFKVLFFRRVCESSDKEKQILRVASSERFPQCMFVIDYESNFLNRTEQIGLKTLPTNETPPDRESDKSHMKALRAFDAI